MQGDLILNANPTANLGAATKQYVDSLISNSIPKMLYKGSIRSHEGEHTTKNIRGLSECKVLLFHFYPDSIDNIQQLSIGTSVGKFWETSSFAYKKYNMSIIIQGYNLFSSAYFIGDNDTIGGDYEYSENKMTYNDTLIIDSNNRRDYDFTLKVEFFKLA